MKLKVDGVPNKDKQYMWNNCVYLNPDDASSLPHPTGNYPIDLSNLITFKRYIYKYIENKDVQKGTIGMNTTQRENEEAALRDEVEVTRFEPTTSDYFLGVLKMSVHVLIQKPTEEFDTKIIQEMVKKNFTGHYISRNQKIIMSYKEKFGLAFKVEDVETVDLDEVTGRHAHETKGNSTGGILMKGTTIILESDTMKLIENENRNGVLFKDLPNVMREIGGLQEEFCEIFRKAIAIRLFPPSVIKTMRVSPARGILLYGPTGCGKTLLAREIAKVLTGKEPQIVYAPELLSRYVGKTEENVRDLFKPAEDEWALKGEESGIHVIIFDKIDALCYGHANTFSYTIVNQLLSKIDGIFTPQNILVIGMTNHIDRVESTLLKPGRFSVHIEIGLPDEKNRQKIFEVHTRGLVESKSMASDVSIEKLAEITRNFTGAEIKMIVQNATNFALHRKINPETLQPTMPDYIQVTWRDFAQAVDQVNPCFGIDSSLKDRMRHGIISYHAWVDEMFSEANILVEQLRNGNANPIVNILISGKAGTGKTSLAARIAELSQFPFVKIIDSGKFLSFPEDFRINEIVQIFSESYNSSHSVIILDELERLLEYNPITPGINNVVFQTLSEVMKKAPPKGKKLLVITTTSIPSLLDNMQVKGLFDVIFQPRVLSTSDEFRRVFEALEIFEKESVEVAAQVLVGHTLPIKKVIWLAERVRADGGSDEVKVERLERLAAELT